MGTCSRCGNPVEFRYINGRCIPLHVNGSCGESTVSGVDDYSGQNYCYESACFSTSCPECGQEVFFIRHNGGSVWIDPPLGPPWYKHSCFDTSPAGTERDSLYDQYKESFGKYRSIKSIEKANNIVIGVTKSTSVNLLKTYTSIFLETGKSSSYSIKIKFNAGFLLSKLCAYDTQKNIIWPLCEPDYKFTVVSHKFNQKIECPECGAMVNSRRIKKHMSKVHGHS